ncbi:AraC family transcriptional regulator [Reticulibacter mediterranei]|uniref:AraC family transcriptional regulator n=1 Tax=Reticulibacter mediterranei TaxID=2778369 RepID=A0A8J3IKS3_9CHLR|nr:AraC family transcriptional regulator [Reticulibacter mediterranei]GHO95628.1 AraC family transcriptional regulator [Reticulibacter mediterranei]
MRLLKARAGREAVKGSITVWRPWQLKQLELFQGVAVSTPSHQCLTQEYLIVCGQSGAIDFQYRDTRLSGRAVDGTLSVIEPGEIWTSQTKDVTYHHLFIDPAWLQQFVTEMLHWEKGLPHFPSHPLFDPSLSRALRDLAVRSQAPASRLQQEEALLSLFAPLLRVHAKDAGALPRLGREHSAVKRTKDYLQAHYAEEVALQELAAEVKLSPFHLAHIFRQTVGLPPHAYQIRLRLARARTLLAQGYDIGYVASETGFFDQSHFTQQFKHHYMMTPANYRKAARFS